MQKTELKPFPNVIIIGAGGVGSYLLPTLLRTIRNHDAPEDSPVVTIYDGDKLELRNMERQLFDHTDVGSFKAGALVKKYKGYYPQLVAVDRYFSGQEDIGPDTVIFVCVDNHPGRMRALNACDMHTCKALLCGNGYTDAEAMFYSPAWKGTPLDPRVYYPDIAKVEDGDPLAPEGCTGHAQQATPQLAIANYVAAGYALHLFWFWMQEKDSLGTEFVGYSPVRHVSNFTRVTSSNVNDLKPNAAGQS